MSFQLCFLRVWRVRHSGEWGLPRGETFLILAAHENPQDAFKALAAWASAGRLN